jgi:hypothetical protein
MSSLTAIYASPSVPSTSPQIFTSALPALSSPPSTQDRVAYLAALQTSLRTLQGDVNTFLTHKMAEDKAADDDAKAEETYGEEVVDED